MLFLFGCYQISGQSIVCQNRIVSVDEFKSSMDSIGLVYELPTGFKSALVRGNGDLYYQFAIINEDSTMEVRYTIFPIKQNLLEYEKLLKDLGTVMIHPNKMYTGIIQANMLNMTGWKDYQIGAFPKDAVNEEFNADVGGSCFFQFDCEFGKGYKYGHFVYLHKNNIADVIITYMDNDKAKHNELMNGPFHSLKFKNGLWIQ